MVHSSISLPEFKLDFSGAVDESYTYHKKGNADAEVVIKERFFNELSNESAEKFLSLLL